MVWATPTRPLSLGEREFPHGYKKNFRWPNGRVSDALMVPIPIWYIRGGHEKILVDTSLETARRVGETTTVSGEYVSVKPEWQIENALAKMNVRPEDIDIVINTHLHDDHFSNNELFTNATFIIQKEEIPLALAPPPWAPYYFKEASHHLSQVLDRVEAIDGDKQVTEGVEVWKLGGHTPGSQAVIVDTKSGRIAIAGDVIYTYYNFEHHWPIGHFWDLNAVIRAEDRLRMNADVVIPNHDFAFWHRFPNGTIG